MNIIQRILVKLLSAETRARIVKEETNYGTNLQGVIVGTVNKRSYLPASTILGEATSAVNANSDPAVNHLVADKAIRTALIASFGEMPKTDLALLVAATRKYVGQ